jgi:fumarate hydratase class II
MAAVQVMGNDAAVGFAASQGNFELNVYMPVLAYDFLQSCRLMYGAVDSFNEKCIKGVEPDAERMAWFYEHSLMRVTALSPHIGYDNAAKVAHTALEKGLTLKQAVKLLGFMDEEQADKLL